MAQGALKTGDFNRSVGSKNAGRLPFDTRVWMSGGGAGLAALTCRAGDPAAAGRAKVIRAAMATAVLIRLPPPRRALCEPSRQPLPALSRHPQVREARPVTQGRNSAGTRPSSRKG